MNSRERVRMALDHKEPDRIPFDFGSNSGTSIHVEAYRNLRKLLGLSEHEIRIMDNMQQVVHIDEDVQKKLGGDAGCIASYSAGIHQIEIKDDMPGYTYYYDEWGIGWRKPTDGGFYYDMFHHPLANATSKEDIENHPWPDPADPSRFEGFKKRARYIVEEEKKASVLDGLCAGVMEQTAFMFGFDKFYPAFVNELDILTHVLDKITDLKSSYWETALELLGGDVDVVIESDDLGGQHGMLISPETYRSVIKPRHKQLFKFVKARTDAKLFLHSCGSIRPIIPDFIEVGVEILNPVQLSAKDMDSAELKREFGDDLVFWGGLVDTQTVLSFGTPGEVRDEVKRIIDNLAPGGGFVAATTHNIPANVPPENIITMNEALQEYGVYNHKNTEALTRRKIQ